MRFSRVVSAMAVGLLLGGAAAPTVLAAPAAHHRSGHHGGGSHGDARGAAGAGVVTVPVPQPVFVPVPVPVDQPLNAPGVLPGALPGFPPAALPGFPGAVLPTLGQMLPPGAFRQTPLQLLPLGGRQYLLRHPLLFCGLDSAGLCETMAEQLAEVAPGFGTAVMDGPDGYGVYLTYQGTS